MKQINECLDRAFQNKSPLKKKWKATIFEFEGFPGPYLVLTHYHHLIMTYALGSKKIKYEWYETATDLRGLNAAKKYLEEKFNEKTS